jgi:hypothetical protein
MSIWHHCATWVTIPERGFRSLSDYQVIIFATSFGLTGLLITSLEAIARTNVAEVTQDSSVYRFLAALNKMEID